MEHKTVLIEFYDSNDCPFCCHETGICQYENVGYTRACEMSNMVEPKKCFVNQSDEDEKIKNYKEERNL